MAEQFSIPDDFGPLKMSDIRAHEAAREHTAFAVAAEVCFGVIGAVVLIMCARWLLRRLPKARSVHMPDPQRWIDFGNPSVNDRIVNQRRGR
jgi:hypothetical protein